MRALVTGVAGFIGSHLAEHLVGKGHEVRGVDCFTPYYGRDQKKENLAGLDGRESFEMVEADLRVRDLSPLVADVDTVFHLAAEPGVRDSWAQQFAVYNEHNVLATQRLLEAARGSGIRRFVYASGSSVYGNAWTEPWRETDLPRPHSPYGATKLAAEHLCALYADVFGVPTVSLRYFTVYGPRQRPDMAIQRFFQAGLDGTPLTIYGWGSQVRDFTHVDDVVTATVSAATADLTSGEVVNVGGGSLITVEEVVNLVSDLLNGQVRVLRQPDQPGDVVRSEGSFERARRLLGWVPTVKLDEGLASQVEWARRRHGGL